ncbi:MAG TPA: helix-turn-helix domain-containing protein [Prolixibacteraceae bacterium]|nr:helix-turn-helix domain-containing protein [Prolixibacteraceae bacterium]
MEIIAWIGFSQALFSGLLTLTKSNPTVSDRLLSGWLILLAIEFLTFGLESEFFPNFVLLTNSFLLFNPALYFYTLSLTKPKFKLKPYYLLHLLPYLFFKITAWIIKEPQHYQTFFNHDSNLWFRLLFGLVGIISWGYYLTRSGIEITRHRKRVQNEFSTIDTYKKIGWILFILVAYILYCFAVLIWGVLKFIIIDSHSITIFNYSILLLFIYILSFYGLKQKPFFKTEATEVKGKGKYKNPVLTEALRENIGKRILEHFEKVLPYLNPELDMQTLSEQLQIPKHHVTEVLNGAFGKNFYQFVNEYRIEKVKKYLRRSNNLYSIEAIGFECGFNSKSTFFSVFKKFTGSTPSEYQKSEKLKSKDQNSISSSPDSYDL